MRRTALLAPALTVVAFILQGCFTEVPVHKYSVKQTAPVEIAKAPQPLPAKQEAEQKAEAKPEGAAVTPKAAPGLTVRLPESGRLIAELEKKNEAIVKRLDLLEQRIAELEKKLKTTK